MLLLYKKQKQGEKTMKKLFVFITVFALLFIFAVGAFAESAELEENLTEGGTTENSTPNIENSPESEISGAGATTESEDIPITTQIVNFITENYTGSSLISLAITVIVYIFYEIKQRKKLDGSIGTLNNNAISIAESSMKAVSNALSEAAKIGEIVAGYKAEFEALLSEIRSSASEKKSLEETLASVEAFLNAAKLANRELSDEIVELLMYANIPNSRKDEIYANHREADRLIEAVGINSDAGVDAV